MDAKEFSIGLDQDLIARIQEKYIVEGNLYGTISQKDVTQDEKMALIRAGWHVRNYQDHPVFEPPQILINWHDLRREHRDNTLHAMSHRLPDGVPWAGHHEEIVYTVIDSTWDRREEEFRVLLNAWAFAAVWTSESRPEAPETHVEDTQTFFFYTQHLAHTATTAISALSHAPAPDEDFWTLIAALQ